MEDKFRKFLQQEIRTIIIIASFLSVVLGTYYSTRNDIAEIKRDIVSIKENHLAHIQKAIEEKTQIDKEQDKKINDIFIRLERVCAILETRK
jgi:hypothetical protein